MAELNKWMKQLNKMEGAVDREYDPYLPENVIQTMSPSVNWIFSKGNGLPLGEFAILWGHPKAGKSVLTNMFVAALHAKDPNAIAMKFDTEMREGGHVDDFWGIDESRFPVFNVNEPELIFDRLKKDIFPMVEQGMPLKMVIIDSLQGIQGVKAGNADSVTNHQMGDHAQTTGKGLMAIMPFLRRNKISLIITAQVRGNLDAGPYQSKEKMGGSYVFRHAMEYYIKVSRDNSAEGKVDALGNKFENQVKDFKGKNEKTGHKIYVEMTESSRGIAGRTGEITLDYSKGIINVEDEIFELSKNLNLIERPNNRTYIFGGKSYSSKEDFVTAIKDDPAVRDALLKAIYKK